MIKNLNNYEDLSTVQRAIRLYIYYKVKNMI